MKTNSTPIVYNKDYYAVMANDVIKGKQEMSLQEARLLRLLITQVAKEDHDFKAYTMRITDLAEFLGVDSSNIYRDIKNICYHLAQRVVMIGEKENPTKPWKVFSWIRYMQYDGEGNLTTELSEDIKPFVLELDKYFTQYKLDNILEMNSFYAIRLYELLKCNDYKGEEYQEYTMEYLRQYFNCEKKYTTRFNDFKKRVIDSAVNEINAKTDLEIREVAYIKNSRRVVGLRFLVWDNHEVMKEREQVKGQMTFE